MYIARPCYLRLLRPSLCNRRGAIFRAPVACRKTGFAPFDWFKHRGQFFIFFISFLILHIGKSKQEKSRQPLIRQGGGQFSIYLFLYIYISFPEDFLGKFFPAKPLFRVITFNLIQPDNTQNYWCYRNSVPVRGFCDR